LPILQHDDCAAILPCRWNDIKLEVYPDADGNAKGELYLDDGFSIIAADDMVNKVRLEFTYQAGKLDSSFIFGSDAYPHTQFPFVASVIIYGVDKAPESCTTVEGGDKLNCFHEESTSTLFMQLEPSTLSYEAQAFVSF